MDIFKLIHKIRKLSIEDKINIAKRLIVFFISIIITLIIGVAIFKVIINSLNTHIENSNKVDVSHNDTFDSLPESIIEEDRKAEFDKPSLEQKKDFSLYNCLEFYDIKHQDGIISLKAKNISNFTIKNISLDLYNKNTQLVTTISLPDNNSIKPDEDVSIDIFSNEDISVKVYSYFKGDKFISVNLINNSATTTDNAINNGFA